MIRKLAPLAAVAMATAALSAAPAGATGVLEVDLPPSVSTSDLLVGDQITVNYPGMTSTVAISLTLPAELRIDEVHANGATCDTVGSRVSCTDAAAVGTDGLTVTATAIAPGADLAVSGGVYGTHLYQGFFIELSASGSTTIDIGVVHTVGLDEHHCGIVSDLTGGLGFPDDGATVLAATHVAGKLGRAGFARPVDPAELPLGTHCRIAVTVPAASAAAFESGRALWDASAEEYAALGVGIVTAILEALVSS